MCGDVCECVIKIGLDEGVENEWERWLSISVRVSVGSVGLGSRFAV